MRKPVMTWLAALTMIVSTAAVGVVAQQSATAQEPRVRGLIYHETTGFRHGSIPYAIEQLTAAGEELGIEFVADQTSDQFTDEGLAQYDVVVFLSTVGGVRGDDPLLTDDEWAAFEDYIRGGGGYAGIHAASDCCDESEFYGELLGNGARFDSHPSGQQGSPGCLGDSPAGGYTGSCFEATVVNEDPGHPSTSHLPDEWGISDELYNFKANPRETVHVLQTLDESSYVDNPRIFNLGNLMGEDHPITWCQIYEGARVWYTGLGHDANIYQNDDSMRMIMRGIMWSAGRWAHEGCEQEGGDAGDPPDDSAFQKVTLNDSPGEPMDLAVLPNRDVLHTTRPGELWLHDFSTGVNSLAATLDVYQHDEEGLQSVAIDPGFGVTNDWVYLYYSPPLDTPPGDAPEEGSPEDFEPFEGHLVVSRFEFDGSTLDLSSEQQILEVPSDRGICCHVGGDINFDGDGNLLLSTGDDTNPFESNGSAPIDERPERNPAYDAQRTSANTNDLGGKLLRITVQPDGSYTIPDGNLFAPGTPDTRPEIYAMGFRNPFRVAYDPVDDAVYVGDYSPDARNANPDRGPAGQGRWIYVDEPANYGWPYCYSSDLGYVDYDFETEESGDPFDCENPVNESPNNTGLTELPPVADPEVMYSYGLTADFPGLETGGIGPMGGPAYRFDPDTAHYDPPVAWPEYYDGKPLFHEWTRDYIKAFTVDDDGAVLDIEPVVDSIATDNPMDIEFGPDGALYMLEYGDGFFSENPEAELSRIDFIGSGGNHSPEVSVEADVTVGAVPLTVQFTSDATDADGDRLRYEWDFDGDGTVDSREENPTHTYEDAGVFLAHLTVRDVRGYQRGRSASDYVEVFPGNDPPIVEFVTPEEGDDFSFGDVVQFEVMITDDQPVDCDNVEVEYALGHDQHAHGLSEVTGCTGEFETSAPGHDPEVDDLSAVFRAEYTDPGGEGGTPPLSGEAVVVLEPSD